MSYSVLSALAPHLRPHGKEAFLRGLSPRSRVFDIGCGNDSPMRAKRVNPEIHYVGLDIGDYYQSSGSLAHADEYIVTPPEDFAAAIEARRSSVDAIVSSHNLEHCAEPERVLRAMCNALVPGGRMYLSFPAEASKRLPRRPKNTLNFFDDPTHRTTPDLAATLDTLKRSGMVIEFEAVRHRPWIPAAVGVLLEPVSILTGRAMPFGTTWALYGFETVIWAGKSAGRPAS